MSKGVPKQSIKNVFSSTIHDKNHRAREILRQNCKKRIREKREILIEKLRFGTATEADISLELKKIIPEIIHEELNSLASSGDNCEPTSSDFVKEVLEGEEEEKLFVEALETIVKKEESATSH